jgi:hypothetical protein
VLLWMTVGFGVGSRIGIITIVRAFAIRVACTRLLDASLLQLAHNIIDRRYRFTHRNGLRILWGIIPPYISHAFVLGICIPFDVARFECEELPREIVFKNVAGSRAVQTAEVAQIVIEFKLSCSREGVVDVIRWTWHEGYDSRVLAFSPGFAWKHVK